ncbi:GNAT family N-acetyltransferase [Methylobacillus glycogenes]|uniref:GNAT family N-acetyltransferase n=1 Tax=Methylobacillus glycogenes TaxID=406 RepID=UPI0004721D99|nr:GNAT family N-acetyltransferase [Methylobacillus glycogenes]
MLATSIFESNRLICRHWIAEDLEPLFSVYSDADAMRWVGDGQAITWEACENWLKVTQANYIKYGYGMFTLVERESGHVIGFAGLVHPEGQPEPEVKYALKRSVWGQGLASEAVPALLAYGASFHGLGRIIATVAADNIASQRVLAKSGMTYSGESLEEDGSVTLIFAWTANSSHTQALMPLQS